ncbi:short chain dehydrogenase family protein [Mycobacterium ulcerans str. Harvey]|uniref:Short chain dehydrogenase family protein n=1 Tax=Mycobacterium ulcerans str. Harvey TaxID=1299332 RepID=A0ABP3AKS2_MYCUL|nr:short chain dehydrogenase family protein [Mycobacterium ulcerans str. Harvey]
MVLDIRGEDVVADLGDRARFAAADVTDEAAVASALDLAETMGTLRIVVNCAGTGNAIRVLSRDGVFSLAAFRKIVDINLVGSFNVLRLAAERIAKTEPVGPNAEERGVIINTASVAAFDGQIGQAAYSASKGGVVGMTLPIARDLASHRIRVMTIAPGLFDTRCWRLCPRRPGRRWVSRCRTRPGWETPTNTGRWLCTSLKTRCSTGGHSFGWRDPDGAALRAVNNDESPRTGGGLSSIDANWLSTEPTADGWFGD